MEGGARAGWERKGARTDKENVALRRHLLGLLCFLLCLLSVLVVLTALSFHATRHLSLRLFCLFARLLGALALLLSRLWLFHCTKKRQYNSERLLVPR